MPALARRNHSPNLRRNAVSAAATPMVKSDSNSSGDDVMDAAPSKYVNIVAANQLPARYESDEESTSPCPEDFDDGATFSDIEFDASLDLDLDEVPSISEAKQVSLTKSASKPILVNISKLAPMEKRVTSSHVRPGLQHSASLTLKTSIGRPIVLQQAGNASYQPPVVALQRPPIRFRAPPPVPPRSEARTGTPSPSTSTPSQQLPAQANLQVTSYPHGGNHATHPSVSTMGTRDSMYDTDDGSSITGDSVASSAPSSVADDADLAARSNEAGLAAKSFEFESRKTNNNNSSSNNAIHDQQDAELERAINDYMMWRSEGSPGEPPESVYKLTSEDKQIVREVEEEEWRRELEMGLATPTPTTYAAYDPFGMRPPSLVRPKAPFQNEAQQQQQQPRIPARANGIRKGFGMVKRAL